MEPPKADVETDKELKGDDWGVAAVPNKDENGVDAVGVENKGVDVAAAGVEKSEDPLPLEADTDVDVFVAADAPGAAVMAKGPGT